MQKTFAKKFVDAIRQMVQVESHFLCFCGQDGVLGARMWLDLTDLDKKKITENAFLL